jgi:hypothetical protein
MICRTTGEMSSGCISSRCISPGCIRMFFSKLYKKIIKPHSLLKQNPAPPRADSNTARERASLCTLEETSSYSQRRKNSSVLRETKLCEVRASLTVETALVLPLFFLGIITIICFMNAVKLQVSDSVKLAEKAKELGMYAYVGGESSGDGIIDLGHQKSYNLPVKIAPLPAVKYWCSARVHVWTGYHGGSEVNGEEEPTEEMVYVTDNESVYHTDSSCTYLKLSIHESTLGAVPYMTNAYGQKYTTCDKCGKGHGAFDVVYITEKGTSYHSDRNCSGLKRTTRLVEKSSVDNLSVCSRCGGEHG